MEWNSLTTEQRHALAHAKQQPASFFKAIAARMVDAQAS
jgi:hypothetical protein